MRQTVIVCDNCDAEIAPVSRGKVAPHRILMGYRGFDLCETCGAGRARDLTEVPLDEWPLYVRREDVRAYLEQMGEINGSPSET